MNSPNHENIDHWLFERLEGNLSAEQEQALSLFLLLNPEYDIDADVWEKTKVNFPEIDPVMVSEMGFGVNQVEEKRKRRPLAFWLLSSTAAVAIILSVVSFLATSPNNRIVNKKAPLAATQKETRIVKTSAKGNKPTNFSYSAFGFKNSIIALNNTKYKSGQAGLNNLSSTEALIGIELSQENTKKVPATFTIPLLQPLHINAIAQGDEPTLAGQEISEESSINEENGFSLKLPSLNLKKSSSLYKYLKKDVVNPTQKDRVYFAQEKSHLDISDAFAGNRSQTRFQSSTIARWIGTADQKLSQQLSIDGYARNLKSGFGIVSNYVDFGQGAIKEWNVRFIYSPKIALGKYVSIEPALSYVVGQKKLNLSKINNHSLFEYNTAQVQQFNYNQNQAFGDQLYYRDLNANLVLNAGPLYGGVSVQNLFKHQDNIHTNQFDTIYRANNTTSFFAGTDFSARHGEILFSPMIMHTLNQSIAHTQVSATLQLKGLVLGGNYTLNAGYGGLIGYQSENFSIIAQSLKTKPYTGIQASFVHQLTIRINTNISRKTRRYLYL